MPFCAYGTSGPNFASIFDLSYEGFSLQRLRRFGEFSGMYTIENLECFYREGHTRSHSEYGS